MEGSGRQEDFFDPARRELVRLSSRVGQRAPALSSVVDAVRGVVVEVADKERAESDASGRSVVSLVSDHGDTERIVGDIQITAAALGEAFQAALEGRDNPGASALTLVHRDGANKLGALGKALARAYRHRDVASAEALDQAIAELGMAYAAAREERSRAAVEQLGKELERLRKQATAIEAKADAAIERAEHAAGIESQDELATHFREVRKTERLAASRLRQWAGRLGVGGPAAAVGAAACGLDHVLAVPLGVSVAGLGVYLGRLAEGHMKVARWANTLEVQTLGVYGYSRLLNDGNARDRVLEGFAAHAYTGHPGEPSGNESPLSAVTEMERLVRLVLEVQKKANQ